MEPIISDVNHTLKGYTVFIDLDKTIISKVSGKQLAIKAVKSGYVKPVDFIRILFHYLRYKTGLIDPQKMAEKMIRWTMGMPEALMDDLCTNIVENTLLPSVYSDALSEIESHKKNDAKIIILSASVVQVCRRIADKIGIEGIICTSLEAKDGCLTGKADGSLCFGDEKIMRLRDYCSYNNKNISESWYYGDSYSDLPVFLTVGFPVCINPDKSLRKAAVEKGWKIQNWRN